MAFVAIVLWILSFIVAVGIIVIGWNIPGIPLIAFVFAAIAEWAVIFGYGCILDVLDLMDKRQAVMSKRQAVIEEEVKKIRKSLQRNNQ